MQDKNSYSSITRLRHNSPTTDKSLKFSKYVQQLSSFEPPTACPQHYHDNINYICIDCKFKCLCGTCLQEGSHKTHHVKNIQKGSKIIDRALNQALIRLRSKSDLLTNLKDYMKIRKSQIYQQYKQYQQIFKLNLDSIALDIEQRRSAINQLIQGYLGNIDRKVDELIQQINFESVNTLQLISLIESKSQKIKQDPISSCLFYQQKNNEIQNLIESASQKFQYFKNKAPDINWKVDLQIFDRLKDKIKSLTLETTQQQVNLVCNFYQNQVLNSMKSDSKLSKVKSGYLYCCKTPMSIENKLTKNSIKTPVNNILKKQNQPSRLNSMPASTSKQKTPYKKSPSKIKVEQGNKKTKKNKK